MALLDTLFEPYERMKISSREKWTEQEKGDGLWVAMEKVHGSNMTCLVDHEGNVAWARRNGMLEAQEDFFGFRKRVGEPHGEKARQLFDLIVTHTQQEENKAKGRVVAISVCGELFGGSYPAPDVAPIKGIRPVQKDGVHYSPDLHFIGFDVIVYYEKEEVKLNKESSGADADDAADTPPESELDDPEPREVKNSNNYDREYLSHSTAVRLLEAAGFLASRPLVTGTADEVGSFPHKFSSTIPALLGLPPLPDTCPNFAEGLVLKPDVTRRDQEGERVIAKKKIEEFGEKSYDAVPMEPPMENKMENSKDEAMERVLYELLACVTPQRLDNVLSKFGRLDWGSKAQEKEVLKQFVDDVFLDEVLTGGDNTTKAQYDGLEPGQKNALRGKVQQRAGEVMRQRCKEDEIAASREVHEGENCSCGYENEFELEF